MDEKFGFKFEYAPDPKIRFHVYENVHEADKKPVLGSGRKTSFLASSLEEARKQYPDHRLYYTIVTTDKDGKSGEEREVYIDESNITESNYIFDQGSTSAPYNQMQTRAISMDGIVRISYKNK